MLGLAPLADTPSREPLTDQRVAFQLPRPQGLLQCVANEFCLHGLAGVPAHDVTGENVDDEDHVRKTPQCVTGRWGDMRHPTGRLDHQALAVRTDKPVLEHHAHGSLDEIGENA